jgi:hypothetical protein
MQPSTTSARSAARPVRPARCQAGLDLVGLTPLMEVTTGTSEVAIGLIDGPVATNHPDLPAQAVRGIGPSRAVACNHGASVACAHGTYVRMTSTLGIRPCGGCRRRAAMLNRWVTFDGRPR